MLLLSNFLLLTGRRTGCATGGGAKQAVRLQVAPFAEYRAAVVRGETVFALVPDRVIAQGHGNPVLEFDFVDEANAVIGEHLRDVEGSEHFSGDGHAATVSSGEFLRWGAEWFFGNQLEHTIKFDFNTFTIILLTSSPLFPLAHHGRFQ